MKTTKRFFICLVALLGIATGTWAENYITDVMLIGGGKSTANDLKAKYQGEGWQVIDKDLNAGAGGAYIFLLYKSEAGQSMNFDQKYITDLLLVDKEIAKDGVDYQNTESFVHAGRTYHKVRGGGDDNFKSYGRNLNHQAKKGGDHIYLYYTREKFDDDRVVASVDCNGTEEGGVGNMGSADALDLNRNASGEYIFLHFDTTTGVTYKKSQFLWCNNTGYFIVAEKDYKKGDTYDGQTIHMEWSNLSDTGLNAIWCDAVRLEDSDSFMLRTVVFDPSFAMLRPKSCYCWFKNFIYLKSIKGLEYLNTSECTNMESMFSCCISLNTVDVSGFDVSKVTNAESMFFDCERLWTIYCDKTWSINKTGLMFAYCLSLQGAVTYKNSKSDGQMANPETGYFTGKWNVNLTTQKLTVSNATPYTNDTLTISSVTGCEVEGITVTGNRTGKTVRTTSKVKGIWKFMMPAEDVTISGRIVTKLQDDADNSAVLELLDGETVKATLAGRTLTTDGTWNTLCLPFALTAEQIADSPLAGAIIKEMDNSASGTSLAAEGTLTLKFKDVNSIEAGKPYMVKYDGADIGSKAVNPVFEDVTISATEPTAVTSSDGKVQFVGQFSPFVIDWYNREEILFLSGGNRIGYSQNPRQLNNFRAHFWVEPIGDGTARTRTIYVDFGDGKTTGIENVQCSMVNGQSNSWHDLQGRRLTGKPTRKGIYANNGRSVIIK